MFERKIGKVISVDSFRLIIQLEDNLKSLFKSGFHDIYEIARINSYVIIPVGADRIVAIVTRVKVQEESEIDRSKGSITLPKAERYLIATMIGTIESGINNDGGKYLQGVYNYPILDNPVWYVIKEDLNTIFDQHTNKTIDFQEDYFLPIGISPSFSDFHIKINPDKFFGKHAAILGNTGSGKSCTVASIIQGLFNYSYGNEKLKSAHFIIFDTNGEYKRAFMGSSKTVEDKVIEEVYKSKELINPLYVDKAGLRIPYWFMNYEDFDYLFQPSALTQAPVFKTSIGLAKEGGGEVENPTMPKSFERYIVQLIERDDFFMLKKHKVGQLWEINQENEIISVSNEIDMQFKNIKDLLKLLGETEDKAIELQTQENLRIAFQNYLDQKAGLKIKSSNSIDLPKYFNFQELISTYIDISIEESEGSSQKLRENISTLKLRLHAYLTDERICEPLMLDQTGNIEKVLSRLLAFILGDLCKVYDASDIDLYNEYYKEQLEKPGFEKIKPDVVNQITILDMSFIPYEVLETITGLIGRLVLNFVSMLKDERGKLPIVMVLEEAQNYIPERDRENKASISKKVFERIAREGRKFGISLLVSSQRPSELSKTVLSQCNSFIIHRIQNPEDQKYVKELVSAANEDILNQLPILPQQHAIIMGDAVRTPVQVRMNTANPRPNSDNPEFIKNWLLDRGKGFPKYEEISRKWEGVENKSEEEELPF